MDFDSADGNLGLRLGVWDWGYVLLCEFGMRPKERKTPFVMMRIQFLLTVC